MKFKKLIAAIALATIAVGAQAATVELGVLQPGENALSGKFGMNVTVGKGSFADVFNFQVASLSSVDGGANIINMRNFLKIPDATFTYTLSEYLPTNASNLLFSGTSGDDGFSSVSLKSGIGYHMDVKGTATGTSGGQYYGSINVTAVPEPESYAMLLVGLGLMATIARRRSKGPKA
jgi:hypothetical protein